MVCSCQDAQKSSFQVLLKDWNKKYTEKKSFFPPELTNHFPKTLDEKNLTFTDNISPEMGSLELMVIDSINYDTISIIQKKLESICIAKYNSKDSCLLVIDRFLSNSSYYKVENTDYDKRIVERPCYTCLYPVPNFWHNDFTTNETECKLPNDFTLYVLDAKQGKYLKDELLTSGWFMPKQWKNGYSKGVAVSQTRKIIIYWLEIW